MFLLVSSVVLVLALSSMCSLFESVLYSVPESHIETLVSKGHKAGIELKRLRKDIDRPISAILTLNTVANTAGAAVAGFAAAEVYGEAWLVYFSAVFTFCVLVFAEIIPKTIGVRYARELAVWVAFPISWMVLFLTPVVKLSGFITSFINPANDYRGPTPDEIRILTHVGQRAGTIHQFEGEVIKNILNLKDKIAAEIMTPRDHVFSLSAHKNLAEAVEDASDQGYSRIPVYDMDPEDIVGLILQRDLFDATVDGRDDEIKISTLMIAVHFVKENTNAQILFDEFLKRHQHLFVVLDESGRMTGVITLEDILEEIVGKEIVDEFDSEEELQEEVRKRREQIISQTR
ncbi:MAG: HlyC/CorC family transporter [SAR324 cluster bacterium]|nr:HlyC/CorC family transporter [SAR324 cluster bacterium]